MIGWRRRSESASTGWVEDPGVAGCVYTSRYKYLDDGTVWEREASIFWIRFADAHTLTTRLLCLYPLRCLWNCLELEILLSSTYVPAAWRRHIFPSSLLMSVSRLSSVCWFVCSPVLVYLSVWHCYLVPRLQYAMVPVPYTNYYSYLLWPVVERSSSAYYAFNGLLLAEYWRSSLHYYEDKNLLLQIKT